MMYSCRLVNYTYYVWKNIWYQSLIFGRHESSSWRQAPGWLCLYTYTACNAVAYSETVNRRSIDTSAVRPCISLMGLLLSPAADRFLCRLLTKVNVYATVASWAIYGRLHVYMVLRSLRDRFERRVANLSTRWFVAWLQFDVGTNCVRCTDKQEIGVELSASRLLAKTLTSVLAIIPYRYGEQAPGTYRLTLPIKTLKGLKVYSGALWSIVVQETAKS